MPDIGEKATEREYKRLRAKIRDVYQQAYEEIYQKNLDFVRRHEQKERQYRQMVAEGRISQADFDAWMRGQVFQGRMWEAQRKQMQETLYHADEIALQMVNDSRYSVFADNANYIGYTLEKGARVMTSFGLYDADSVRRLIKEEPYLLPPRKLAGRDKSYQWYNRQIQTAITQGIIQGEPLKDIAKRIGQQTGETDMNAMLRNARTMQTGAQNAGRIEAMHQAQRLGINVKKQWMATLDSHTRDAHQALDGQIAEVDKPFKSELGDIMYPGDQTAKPANVWNCRCTLVSVYPEYPDEMMKRRDNETGEIIDNMTYREWEEMKRGEQAEPIDIPVPQREESPREYIEFDDTEDALDYYIDNGESWVETLTEEEKRAVSDYGYNYLSAECNGYLRGETDKYSDYQLDAIKEQIRKLDQAIEKGSIPDDMRLYRGVGRDYLGIDFSNPEALIGKTVKEGGFMSVSGESEVAETYGRGVVLDMNVPKGTHAAYVDLVQSTGSELREYYQEDGDAGNIEYLLERGGSLKFTGYKYEKDENGKEYVRMFCEFVHR